MFEHNPVASIYLNKEDLNEALKIAEEKIKAINVCRLSTFEEFDDVRQLTLCNLWRLVSRGKLDRGIEIYEWDLTSMRWKRVKQINSWPTIYIRNVAGHPNIFVFWRGAIDYSLEKIFRFAFQSQYAANLNYDIKVKVDLIINEQISQFMKHHAGKLLKPNIMRGAQ